MIFVVSGHIEKILRGEKTQTRRRVDQGDSGKRVRYAIAKSYAVCPGRGKVGVGRIEVVSIRKERVSDISEADAIAEGGYTRQEYLELWQGMYKVDPAEDWCWKLEFKVVGKEKERR